MSELIELFKKVVVQIATPYSTGTGFCLKKHGLIVTSDHLVRDNREVVVEGKHIDRQLVRVLYSDPQYDLAFLELPDSNSIPGILLGQAGQLKVGSKLIAVGFPFSNQFVAKHGAVLEYPMMQHETEYIQHDAAIEAVNSGGPVVNEAGLVVGVNTFASWEENKSGLALSEKYLRESIMQYRAGGGQVAVRCYNCHTVVFESVETRTNCPNCGASISLPSSSQVFEPEGVGKSIEALLIENGYDIALSRIGPNNWEVREGSARIDISYYEKTGLIVGDAYLCSLPPDPSKPLYEFLLKQNYRTQGLAFSVKGRDIVLSLLIYDRYLNAGTAAQLFKHLFERADYFDNILVEKYGASWKYD